MSDSEHISKHIRIYVGVFIALLIGTVLTVAMYYKHFESVAITVAVALVIATAKASLVAGFFMHLVSEKRAIYAILAFTAFFFAGMLALIIWSAYDLPELSTWSQKHVPSGAAAPAPQ